MRTGHTRESIRTSHGTLHGPRMGIYTGRTWESTWATHGNLHGPHTGHCTGRTWESTWATHGPPHGIPDAGRGIWHRDLRKAVSQVVVFQIVAVYCSADPPRKAGVCGCSFRSFLIFNELLHRIPPTGVNLLQDGPRGWNHVSHNALGFSHIEMTRFRTSCFGKGVGISHAVSVYYSMHCK